MHFKTWSEKSKRKPVVKSTSHTSRGLKFSSQTHIRSSQPPVTPAGQTPSSGVHGHCTPPHLSKNIHLSKNKYESRQYRPLEDLVSYIRNYCNYIWFLYRFPTEAQKVKELMVPQRLFWNSDKKIILSNKPSGDSIPALPIWNLKSKSKNYLSFSKWIITFDKHSIQYLISKISTSKVYTTILFQRKISLYALRPQVGVYLSEIIIVFLLVIYLQPAQRFTSRTQQANGNFKSNMSTWWNVRSGEACLSVPLMEEDEWKRAPPLQGNAKVGHRERRMCFLDLSVLHMPGVHKQLCSCAFPTQTSLALCFQTNRLQHLAAGCSCLLNEGEFNLWPTDSQVVPAL